jgi:hypothetical protein
MNDEWRISVRFVDTSIFDIAIFKSQPADAGRHVRNVSINKAKKVIFYNHFSFTLAIPGRTTTTTSQFNDEKKKKGEIYRKEAPHDSHETRLRMRRKRRKKREQKRGIASQLRVNDLKGMSGISARGGASD